MGALSRFQKQENTKQGERRDVTAAPFHNLPASEVGASDGIE